MDATVYWRQECERLQAEIERLRVIPKCDPKNCTFGNHTMREVLTENSRLQTENERLLRLLDPTQIARSLDEALK